MELRRAASSFLLTVSDGNPSACQRLAQNPGAVAALMEVALATETGGHASFLRLHSMGVLVNCLAHGLDLAGSAVTRLTDSLGSLLSLGLYVAGNPCEPPNDADMDIEGGSEVDRTSAADEGSGVVGSEGDDASLSGRSEALKLAAEVAANLVLALATSTDDPDLEDWQSDDESNVQGSELVQVRQDWEYAAAVLLGASLSSLSSLFAGLERLCGAAASKTLPPEFQDMLEAAERVCSVVTNIASCPSVHGLSIDVGRISNQSSLLQYNYFRGDPRSEPRRCLWIRAHDADI